MPTNVLRVVPPANLRKGDIIVSAGERHTVVGCSVKAVKQHRVNATVTFDDDSTATLPLAVDVAVNRVEQTEEEKAADLRRYTIRCLRELTHEFDDPAKYLLAQIDAANGDPRILDSWTLAGFLKSQAMAKIGADVARQTSWLVDNQGMAEDDALVAAWARWYVANVLDRGRDYHDPLSRSTSTASNLLEDVDRWAVKEVGEQLTRYGYQPVRDAAAALMEANRD